MHEGLDSGIEAILSPAIVDSVSSLAALHDSQTALSAQVERLAEQLVAYESGTTIVDMKPALAKLHETARRLTLVNDTLAVISHRLVAVKKELVMKSSRST